MTDFKRIIINDIPTNYFIYNDGRCFSENIGRFLKPRTSLRYHRYSLSVSGQTYDKYAHRLVAEYFIENTEDKPQVNHKDGDRHNNHFSNLEWVTSEENLAHQFENQLFRDKKIRQFDLEGQHIANWSTATQAGRTLGLSSGSISSCCVGTQKNSGGFQWCYEGGEEAISNKGLEHHLRGQAVEMRTMEGELVRTFNKVSDVYPYFNKKDNGYISQVLKGRRKSAWGYKFQYKYI